MVVAATDTPARTLRAKTSVGPLVAFFVLAYAVSWAWAMPFALTDQVVNRGDAWPTHYPALLGPAIAAVVVTAWTAGRAGLRDLLCRVLRWRVALLWWLVAVSPAIFLAVTLLVMAAVGEDLPAVADFGLFTGTPAIGLLGVFLLITFVGALGEETGWRGFALPHLQRRFSPLTATLILAPLWFFWHLPQFFIIATYRDFAVTEYVGMILGLTAGAVILTWLYNWSGGSVLLVIVWHGVYNFVGATEAAVGVGVIAAAISTLVMVQGIALVVLDLLARRRGRPSVLGQG
jgi:membrane protease YdiL (CAAX protease family)